MSENKPRVAVVGARSKRQGTGEYIASAFAHAGCNVCAIVATSTESGQMARQGLLERHNIQCAVYTDLGDLCQQEHPDIVAICSPAETHLVLIKTSLEANAHVFCEKPLWWQTDSQVKPPYVVIEEVHSILDQSRNAGRLLKLNTQWPFTLPAFKQLHPDTSLAAAEINNITMWMSPVSTGKQMIVDAAPHLLSMLYTITGGGNLQDILISKLSSDQDGHCRQMLIQCIHNHQDGKIDVDFLLTHHAIQPRPAGYSFNGKSANRIVKLPEYLISFADKDRHVPVRDPLKSAVEDFLNAVKTGEQTDSESLLFGMLQLRQLMSYSHSVE